MLIYLIGCFIVLFLCVIYIIRSKEDIRICDIAIILLTTIFSFISLLILALFFIVSFMNEKWSTVVFRRK